MMKTKIVVIAGPTGIGKTGFAVRAAERFDGEIVGAGSMQIYRYMNIGTAKPDKEEQALAKHHLIDIADPDEPFDAAAYIREADRAIQDITERGKIPIVAGGTGLYIRALVHGLYGRRSPDPAVMERLERELDTRGAEWLHGRLAEIDPQLAETIHPNDTFRVTRALEVFESTGTVKSNFLKNHNFEDLRYDCMKIGLCMDRGLLYERINRRVDEMIASGLTDEVKNLLKMGYSGDLKSMQSIGYRHINEYLEGKNDFEETVRTLKRDTRRFAKRQFTWFSKEKSLLWLSPSELEDAWKRIDEFLG
ncbi:MAG: tRNA (adenosine(37)-N6)-dimethylallyltransferase MiaA [Desulfarculaceae bacterium]|nr:tRNA (adenosine(37)-N6)-dimethylallyltransferase MiaA [Desulfarculaceae bacterium]